MFVGMQETSAGPCWSLALVGTKNVGLALQARATLYNGTQQQTKNRDGWVGGSGWFATAV